MTELRYIEAIGRRKRATARVRIYPGGEGTERTFIVNGKTITDFFTRFGDIDILAEPLADAGFLNKMSITVLVKGGGVSGQTSAVKLGLARALVKMDAELRPMLRTNGHLTRDPRIKERKKPGLKRARKAPTYTKR